MPRHVLQYLEDIVKEKPDKIAFADEGEALTFSRLYRLSRGVGTFLHQKGIYKRPVVVFMRKAPREIAAFFGVITGGNYYVPIDEEMPAGRIQLILNNVRSPLVICDPDTAPIAAQFDLQGGELALFEEAAAPEPEEAALAAIRDRAIDTDPIYIVFTSGSTGIPKGVAACHRSVID